MSSLVRVPILRHGMTKWDRELLPQSEVDARIARLRAAMQAEKLDALLVYGDMWHSGGLAYVTNFHPFDARMPGFAVLTPTLLEAVLKVSSRDLTFISPFIWAPAQPSDFLANDLAGQVEDIIMREGLQTKRVGFAGAALMPPALAAAIKPIFPNGTIPADALLNALRAQKTSAERAILRLAATKGEAAIAEIAAHVAPGVNETELAAFADYAARKAGAQDVEFLMHTQGDRMPAAGNTSSFPFRPHTERALERGEHVGVYLTLQFHGYWTELSQSVYAGTPSAQQRAVYDSCVAAFDQQLEGTTPAGAVAVWTHGIGLDREEGDASVTAALHVAAERNGERAFYGRTIAREPAGNTILTASLAKSA
jgi:Xaa-Pro aminopeptidase